MPNLFNSHLGQPRGRTTTLRWPESAGEVRRQTRSHHGHMLVGYWPNETPADREYRRLKLREFGARPYPMPYVRTPELRGFQRWIVGAYDKRVSWQRWTQAGYEPRNLE